MQTSGFSALGWIIRIAPVREAAMKNRLFGFARRLAADIHIERYGIHKVFLSLHGLSYPAGTKAGLLCCTVLDVLLL